MRGRRPLVLYVYAMNQSDTSVEKVLMEDHRHDVTAASDATAMPVLANDAVDAVILDIAGHGHGVRLMDRMKRIKPHIPVVLVVDGSSKIHGKATNADAILLKNDAPRKLLGILDDLLNVRYPFFMRWFGNWKCRTHA